MAWSWKYDVAEGPTTTGGFPTQAEAEAWVAQTWAELYAAGAGEVTLLEGDRVVYSMSLEPAG